MELNEKMYIREWP